MVLSYLSQVWLRHLNKLSVLSFTVKKGEPPEKRLIYFNGNVYVRKILSKSNYLVIKGRSQIMSANIEGGGVSLHMSCLTGDREDRLLDVRH